ncbi:MAG: polymerase protein, partial [candidate division WWE3 bacterium GW2011_GWA1_46_21]
DMININSQVQLMELFNNKLGLNIPSTNDAILNRVNNPIVKLLRDYRGYAKLVSTYGENLLQKINPVTGRLHPSFLQIATATGRFACNDPNVQNIPRNSKEFAFRECFNPAPGYKIVDADFSNFEMRILADFSGDEKMINALKNELDIHSYTASLMFDKPYSNDFKKKFPELRQMAKPIGFGLMYGMGAPGLVGRIYAETGKEITVEESDQLINKFFQSYPRVKSFLDKMAKNAQKNGWSSTPAGRKRWYHLPDKDDIDYRRKLSSIGREAKNHPIQGTNADAIKYALVFAHERMVKDKIDGAIILTVHDEIACEVREDQAQDFAPALASEMVRAGELFLKKVPVVSQPFVGDVWEH